MNKDFKFSDLIDSGNSSYKLQLFESLSDDSLKKMLLSTGRTESFIEELLMMRHLYLTDEQTSDNALNEEEVLL